MTQPTRNDMPCRDEYLDLRVVDADFRIRAPKGVLGVIDRMVAHVPRKHAGTSAILNIDVRFEFDLWRVTGSSPRANKTLGQRSGLPQVAGATVSAMMAELAHHRDVRVLRATAVEYDGSALMMVGDDWESCVTIAAHLHTRGWHILGGDYVVLECDTLNVLGFKKMLHANSSSVPAFPLWYRKAVEASPWYANASDIAFYAIDPTLIDGEAAWGDHAPVRALLKVDGHAAEYPSLEVGPDLTATEELQRIDFAKTSVHVGSLILGGMIETCDFLEHWFRTLSTSG